MSPGDMIRVTKETPAFCMDSTKEYFGTWKEWIPVGESGIVISSLRKRLFALEHLRDLEFWVEVLLPSHGIRWISGEVGVEVVE